MHPLLDEHGEELDYFTRHPRILPTVQRLLGGDDACFTQFDFRQSPGGLELRNDLHHDVGSAGTSAPETIMARPFGRHDTLCSIVYLSDVNKTTPAFAVVPGSHRVPVWPEPDARDSESDIALYNATMARGGVAVYRSDSEERQLCEALGEEDIEAIRLHAPAGSAVLYDVSLFHGRSAGGDVQTIRRTMHQYYGRHSGAPNVPWVLLPKRLWEHDNPAIRRYYRNLTPVQEAYAASGYDLLATSVSPRLLSHLSGNTNSQRFVQKGNDPEIGQRFLASHGPAHLLKQHQ